MKLNFCLILVCGFLFVPSAIAAEFDCKVDASNTFTACFDGVESCYIEVSSKNYQYANVDIAKEIYAGRGTPLISARWLPTQRVGFRDRNKTKIFSCKAGGDFAVVARKIWRSGRCGTSGGGPTSCEKNLPGLQYENKRIWFKFKPNQPSTFACDKKIKEIVKKIVEADYPQEKLSVGNLSHLSIYSEVEVEILAADGQKKHHYWVATDNECHIEKLEKEK